MLFILICGQGAHIQGHALGKSLAIQLWRFLYDVLLLLPRVSRVKGVLELFLPQLGYLGTL